MRLLRCGELGGGAVDAAEGAVGLGCGSVGWRRRWGNAVRHGEGFGLRGADYIHGQHLVQMCRDLRRARKILQELAERNLRAELFVQRHRRLREEEGIETELDEAQRRFGVGELQAG